MDKVLFLVGAVDVPTLDRVRKQYPESRVVFLDLAQTTPLALRLAAETAQTIVVQDCLAERASDVLQEPVRRLSEVNVELAARLDRLPAQRPAPDGEIPPVINGPVLFCPSNDTHVKLFSPIAPYLSQSAFLHSDPRPEERAAETMRKLGIPFRQGGVETLRRIRPSVVVVGNDWGRTVVLLNEARRLQIPTVCLQEGCLDFDSYPRMRQCDYPFVQGPIMLRYLCQRAYFLTGNPRFDALCPMALPASPVVMINSNFTYDVHEDQRDRWVRDAVAACRKIDVPFFISQHPRDTGQFPDLPVRKSGAMYIHQYLSESTVVITRFSTIIYEAMCLGRNVVYYNPHGETMRLFNEDQTGGIAKVYSAEQLVPALARALEPPCAERQARFERFLDMHCDARDGRAALRCASALAHLSNGAWPLRRQPWWSRWLRLSNRWRSGIL